jgi:hypothetical protein
MYVLLIVVCTFVLFLLAIVLSDLLRFTDSDYSFGIFKLFLQQYLGIAMGRHCMRCLVAVFVYSDEAEFMQGLLRGKNKECLVENSDR